MASTSSLAARLLIRHGKSAASLLFRGRTTNLTETMQNTGPAIRSLFRFNQTPTMLDKASMACSPRHTSTSRLWIR
ncbi:unnamed protein product [Arabis nemorensis]|uniref:Uncharacterized protein n=1 Tax=Arabis nemorensis TaxID=586526 RepID=A0A565B7R2_9BRAS|nr:unnamed protein product [Arabis nemorensis]